MTPVAGGAVALLEGGAPPLVGYVIKQTACWFISTGIQTTRLLADYINTGIQTIGRSFQYALLCCRLPTAKAVYSMYE